MILGKMAQRKTLEEPGPADSSWTQKGGCEGEEEVKLIPGLPSWSVVQNLPASVGDTGSIPGRQRSHMLQGS